MLIQNIQHILYVCIPSLYTYNYIDIDIQMTKCIWIWVWTYIHIAIDIDTNIAARIFRISPVEETGLRPKQAETPERMMA